MKLTINRIAEFMFFISSVTYAVSFLGLSYEDIRGVVDLDSTLWHTLFIFSAPSMILTVVILMVTGVSLSGRHGIGKED